MAKVLLLGGTGFLGTHMQESLQQAGHVVAPADRQSADLRRYQEVRQLLYGDFDAVVHLAYPGSKGGISTSVHTPHTLASDLLRMDLNVIEACAMAKIPKLLCVGSACAYPETTPTPTREADLWNGYPEPVNAAYGIAKRTQLTLLQAARQQYGLNSIHVILGNLYGPGDRSAHVIPALITKVRRALLDGGPVVVWGRPEVTRSFLYVHDAAEGLVRALADYDVALPLNLMSPEETAMIDLVTTIAKILGYRGPITFDPAHPTGHLRRAFDITRLRATLHWEPPTRLADGLAATIQWQVDHVALD